MTEPFPSRLAHALNDEVLGQLDLATAIDHGPEHGRAREEIVRRFLRRLIPSGFGIDTGFVIDAEGNVSSQIDIVIYRTGYHPVFEVGGIRHFMIESVAAVIENKSRLTSTADLRSAFANIRSVKTLDITGGGRNYVVLGDQPGPLVSDIRDDGNVNVFGAVITDRTVTRETFLDELVSFLEGHPRREWPNMYVAIRDFAGIFLKDEDGLAITTHHHNAVGVALTDPDHEGGVPPLVDFASRLVNELRIFSLIDFRLEGYFPRSRVHHHFRELPQ